VRLRLSDHDVDMMREGIDVAFRLGVLEDSSLRMRGVLECERVLVAAPSYLDKRGEPQSPDDLLAHDCLMLRYPGAREHFWTVRTPDGPRKLDVRGPYDSDDGDVLTGWALAGHGIVMKPRFEVEPFLREGRLKTIMTATPPIPVQLAAVYPHKKYQDPKVRLLLDFMVERCQRMIRDILDGR
ncbi:MAG: substrate binding domain-containing protein, partial [Nitratireductor sp.]